MKQHADITRLLLLEKYASPALAQAATTALKALAEMAAHTPAPVQKQGLPLPHGSTYQSLDTLVSDVSARCQAAGLNTTTTTNLIALVSNQYQGAYA